MQHWHVALHGRSRFAHVIRFIRAMSAGIPGLHMAIRQFKLYNAHAVNKYFRHADNLLQFQKYLNWILFALMFMFFFLAFHCRSSVMFGIYLSVNFVWSKWLWLTSNKFVCECGKGKFQWIKDGVTVSISMQNMKYKKHFHNKKNRMASHEFVS